MELYSVRAFIYFAIRHFLKGGILDGYGGWMWNFSALASLGYPLAYGSALAGSAATARFLVPLDCGSGDWADAASGQGGGERCSRLVDCVQNWVLVVA